MLARKDIEAGDELTFDYATSDTAWNSLETCLCGSRLCRGSVLADDWLIPELQERYGRHFAVYIWPKLGLFTPSEMRKIRAEVKRLNGENAA